MSFQSELLSLGAKLSLTEQFAQKLDRQRSHLSVESGVYKYKLLECRDKVLSLIKAQQQNFLAVKGGGVAVQGQLGARLERLFGEAKRDPRHMWYCMRA